MNRSPYSRFLLSFLVVLMLAVPLASTAQVPRVAGTNDTGCSWWQWIVPILNTHCGVTAVLNFPDTLINLFYKLWLGMITAMATVLYWFVILFSYILVVLITKGGFLSHVFVTNGWPFVQGLTNLGFLLILLYIALLITLRLDAGQGLKRMVPKLLLAALLVNFSLVIGGTIIDVSRVAMALIMRSLGQSTMTCSVSNIGEGLLFGLDRLGTGCVPPVNQDPQRAAPLFRQAFWLDKVNFIYLSNQYEIPVLRSRYLDKELTPTECNDRVNNDGVEDPFIDDQDPDCHTDHTLDQNTYDPEDMSEGNKSCSDTGDNDLDGAIDEADSHCHSDGNPANHASYNPELGTEFDTDPAGRPIPLPPPPKIPGPRGVPPVDFTAIIGTMAAGYVLVAVVLGLAVIAVAVFIRYLALLLLLAVSPIAYLGLAFPNTAGFATKWWQLFLKYVFLGPAALVVLIFVARMPSNLLVPNASPDALTGLTYWINLFLDVSLVFLTLGIGAKAATSIGGIGATATLGAAKGLGQKAGKTAARHPFLTGLGLTAATGGVSAVAVGGLAALGRGVGAQKAKEFGYGARDFYKEATKPIRKFAKTGEYSRYDEKGQLKPDKTSRLKEWGQTVAGSYAGGTKYDPVPSGIRESLDTLKGVKSTFTPASFLDPKIQQATTGNMLRYDAVMKALIAGKHGNATAIAEVGNLSQVNAIVNSKVLVRAGNAAELSKIEEAIRTNTGLSPQEQANAIKQLQATVREVDKETA